MYFLKKKTSDIRRSWWLQAVIVTSSILLTVAVSWVLYEHTVKLLTENLRERLLSIGITQASNIDYRDLNALQVEGDWKKPQWARVVNSLKRAKSSNENIVFMYIFRKVQNDPTKMEFVADAESINPYVNTDDDPSNDVDANMDGVVEADGADQLQWPGQEYPTPPPETFQAYFGSLTTSDLYEDAYGKVLTGYAPIKDESGVTVAILGTDIKADDFLTVTKQTLYPFLLFIAFLILAITFLSMRLVNLWEKRLKEASDLDRQKDELLGIVSHQLAKPVTAIKWTLESMLDGDTGPLSTDQKTSAVTMRTMATNLSDLVSMILDVSRIQLGKITLDPQPMDLNALFKEIMDIVQPSITDKKINFVTFVTPKILPMMLLDRRYTRMTFENLITNAVKYTPQGGSVHLTLSFADGRLRFSVKDTGCGIPKAEQGKIFGKMYRASNVRNAQEGNGFGLYVAKGAVEAQGGKIWFESAEGKGTTFNVDLPVKLAA